MGIVLSGVLYQQTPNHVCFMCPGCKRIHCVGINEAPVKWDYNGNPEKPTFSPSILTRGREMTPKGRQDYEMWLDEGCLALPNNFLGFEHVDTVCHSFVTDGMIQFLGDCTHDLKGQTVPLDPIPDWLAEESTE